MNLQFYNPVERIHKDNLKPYKRKLRFPQSNKKYKEKNSMLIIDYGAWVIKAVIYFQQGFAYQNIPSFVFRTLVSKSKQLKTDSIKSTICTSFEDYDFNKNNYRSPYQRNIIQHSGLIEYCNDFIFSQLGFIQDRINCPIMINQTFVNIHFCRANIIEMFFQCYKVPYLFIGIDSLFAYFYQLEGNLQRYKSETRLLISMGANSTHIIPIIQGKIDYFNIKRLNVGGNNMIQSLGKGLLFRYPHLKDQLKNNVILSLCQNYCQCAMDYNLQMEYFSKGKQGFVKKNYRNQIVENNYELLQGTKLVQPLIVMFDKPSKDIISQQDKIRKQQTRKRIRQRLKQAIAKRKEQKQKLLNQELVELQSLLQKYNQDQQGSLDQIIALFGEKGVNGLNKNIKKIKIKLKLIPSQNQQTKFNLVDIPDSKLTSEQLRTKKIQLFHKQTAQNRAKKKKQQQQQKQLQLKIKQQTPDIYLQNLYAKREEMIKKIKNTQIIKQQLSKRNSRINQQRMQTLAQLAQDSACSKKQREKKQKEDTFGLNDQDWQVYNFGIVQQDQDIQQKLMALQLQLREMDPQFDNKVSQNVDPWRFFVQQYEILLLTQLVKGPEIYFQPSLVGCQQAGIHTIINLIMKNYDLQTKNNLLKNILLVVLLYNQGGSSTIIGFDQRLKIQLTSLSNVGSQIQIKKSKNPSQGAWLGMKTLYEKYRNIVLQGGISIQEYKMMGSSMKLLKEHYFSNIYQ